MFIDIGVGTYTANTLGAHRFDMQSQYHNCPTINGILQKEGQFASYNVSLKVLPNDEGIFFCADIAGAYPKESQAKHWVRTISFNKTENSMQIEEQFELSNFLAPQKLHFITVQDMKVEKIGQGLLLSHGTGKVAMGVDWTTFDLAEEVKSLEKDHQLTQVWGENVKRITLTTKEHYKELKGHFTVSIREHK